MDCWASMQSQTLTGTCIGKRVLPGRRKLTCAHSKKHSELAHTSFGTPIALIRSVLLFVLCAPCTSALDFELKLSSVQSSAQPADHSGCACPSPGHRLRGNLFSLH